MSFDAALAAVPTDVPTISTLTTDVLIYNETILVDKEAWAAGFHTEVRNPYSHLGLVLTAWVPVLQDAWTSEMGYHHGEWRKTTTMTLAKLSFIDLSQLSGEYNDFQTIFNNDAALN
jgi:hypothetical protein